ncbi:hypothetical protein GOV12_01740 [Candidatus Pacearchaeota archaeon]|nr:hypothetical protein [Candidatus Pacearchaeota archaeon]
MEVKAYLSNQLGFSETGKYVLDNLIKPKIKEIGITILDPFEVCGAEIDWNYLNGLKIHEDIVKYWRNFSLKVTPINNRLMKESKLMLAILDGGHAVDDGEASEIGYYAGLELGPIFGLRSDIRCGENMAVSINPQVLGYILSSSGELIEPPNAVDRWFESIKKWYDEFVRD